MSFLGDVGKFFSGPDLLPNIVTLGGYGITKGTLQLGLKALAPAEKAIFQGLVSKRTTSGPNTLPHRQPIFAPQPDPGPPVNITYGAPYYTAPTYGGGGSYDAYDLQPSYNPYVNPYAGGGQWGYSTPSPTFFPTPSVTSSAPAQDHTWEDLISLAPLLLL